MTTLELLQLLEGVGISLSIRGDRLVVNAPAGVITPTLRELIASHKASLMSLLARRQGNVSQLPLVGDESQVKPNQTSHAGNGVLAALYAERDRLLARWHKGLDFLENLRERKGQECPEFEKYFALWSEIDADLRRVLDRSRGNEYTGLGDLGTHQNQRRIMSVQLQPTNIGTLMMGDNGEWERVAREWLLNFRSERTRATYRAAWRDFLRYIAKHPAHVTRADVIAYRDYLATQGRARASQALGQRAASIGVKLAALASFYEHAKREGLISVNPVEGVQRPKVASYSAARWLTRAEARALLRAPDRKTLEGKRDYAILLMILTMGLRRAEVLAIRCGDLIESGDRIELRYTPKGGEEQTRPVPLSVWRAIRDYLDARGDGANDAPLFVAHDHAAGMRASVTPMTGEALRLMIARYSLAALGRVVNPHALRHTCAGEAWESTRDLRKVQSLLGHASATTTERYLHRREDDRGALGDALAVLFGAEN